MKNSLLLVYLAALPLLYTSCGTGVHSTGKINKYVEEFFKGNGKMLYFIKPIEFASVAKEKLDADFTVNKGDTAIHHVIANMSIYGTPPFATADSIKLTYKDKHYTDIHPRLLYHENERGAHTRQGIQIPNEFFKDALDADKVMITVYMPGKTTEYNSGKQWQKTHGKIYGKVYW